MDLRSLPKLELHLHLEGAAPPALVRRLADERGIELQGLFAEDGGYASSDFLTFLAAYEEMSKVFFEPGAYRALTEAVLTEQAANGVIYSEIFLSPPSLFGGDEGAWGAMREAAEEGAEAAEEAHGVLCRFIPVVIRHHGPEAAAAGAKAICAAPRGRMRGFGMAGDENQFEPKDFAAVFQDMKEAGFRLTCHAGEWGGPASVRAALDDLHVERLGHGVRAAENPALVSRIAAEGVTLECCPGSNVALGIYPALAAHPIAALKTAGCAVTVSTDDPPFFRSTMTKEYEGLAGAFGWGATEFVELGRTALAAAFCEDELKPALAARLDAAA